MVDKDNDSDKRVADEEGSVDTKIKTRILKSRERVDSAEEALFVEAATDETMRFNRQQQIVTWGTMVKQFLRTIEPLLRSDEVKGSTKYYEEIEIGKEVLTPPDTDGYPFSRVSFTNKSDKQLRRMLGLPRGVSIPKPMPVTFNGLRSIIEAPDVLEQRWVVTVDNSGPPPTHKEVYPHEKKVISKDIFVDAVRYADQFLQEAGIGLDLEGDETPIIRDFDQSGGKSESTMDSTEYRGDPDI